VDGQAAHRAGFQVGDKILEIDGQKLGTEMDPLELPDYFYNHRQDEIKVKISRKPPEGNATETELTVRPEDRPGWAYLALGPNVPFDVPSIGLAYHMVPTIVKVLPDSPAAKAGIQAGDYLKKIEFLPPPEGVKDGLGTETFEVIIDETEAEGQRNWAYAFRLMQITPARDVKLTMTNGREFTITPEASSEWFLPDNRGIRLEPMTEWQQADRFLEAVQMGITHTTNSASDIYLMLRNLIGGSISTKELHGPVGIAKVAYSLASNGMADLLLFLGLLSVNLAVLNFLPIPVLDGGHMVFLIWEGVTRSKPSERVLWVAQALGFLFVVTLMMYVLFLDIFVHKHVN
jgi:regulator of sigma E protease